MVRHAKAGSRDNWDGDDRLRPLSTAGRKQAQAIAELLPLYGPDRIGSAPQVRCRDTVAPLADALGLPVVDEPLLSEGSYDDDPDATLKRVRELAAQPGVTVVCSQGGVIPDVVAALAREAARAGGRGRRRRAVEEGQRLGAGAARRGAGVGRLPRAPGFLSAAAEDGAR